MARSLRNWIGGETMLFLLQALALGAPVAREDESRALASGSSYTDWFQKARPLGVCLPDNGKHSQLHQDQWALETATPMCMRGGYYVDIGANDGVKISNTFALDHYFGWRGLCSDPFPHGMENRSCTVAAAAIWDKPGETIIFDHTSGDDGVLSKIESLTSGREWIVQSLRQEKVPLVTKTLH